MTSLASKTAGLVAALGLSIASASGLAGPIGQDPKPSDEHTQVTPYVGSDLFRNYCAVCHGMAGKGDGTAVKYGVFPFPLVSGPALSRTDGYIFGMIRNGRGNMPPYNRIEEKDRWDVVNYVRGLQGKLPAAVPTGPLAVPGFNGPAVPGPTTLGPTRPVPHTAAELQSMNGASQPPAAVPGDTTRRTGADTTRAGARRTPGQGEGK